VGRSADPRRVTEARHRRLRTHGVALSALDRLKKAPPWRTFLANHVGGFAFISPMTYSYRRGDDDVDACGLPFRALLVDGLRASNQRAAVD
jgi:hypothetical protein